MSEDRDTETEDLELIKDPKAKAARESENGIRQFRAAERIIIGNLSNEDFRLTQAIIFRLHVEALKGIHRLAGTYRNTYARITNSKHETAHHLDIADLMADMCHYVNSNWKDQSALHLAAYVMWRLNWIHPFADGNGRTARTLSYLVLSVKLKSLLPGSPAIPDLIDADKDPYYASLESADDIWRRNKIVAIGTMEAFLEKMLAKQLESATRQAGL
jgi:Fic family protein